MILDVVIEAGQSGRCRALAAHARAPHRYLRPCLHPDRWPPTAAMPAAATSRPPRKAGRQETLWRSTRSSRAEDRRHGQEPLGRSQAAVDFRAGHRGRHLVPEAGLWLGALHLEGPGLDFEGLPRSGPWWWPTIWRSSHASRSGIACRLTTRSAIQDRAVATALDHVRILPRTPTAATKPTIMSGKCRHLKSKIARQPRTRRLSSQPKTPADFHRVYGRTLGKRSFRPWNGSRQAHLPR